jgi:predicted nucleic acid-binding protein
LRRPARHPSISRAPTSRVRLAKQPVAYYCPEPLSRHAERLVRGRIAVSVSDLTEVELLFALARKTRSRELAVGAAERAAAQFLAHLEANLYNPVPLERRHYRLARDWIVRFTTPLRTLDALHLAVVASEGLRLATADRALARSARALGIAIVGGAGRAARRCSPKDPSAHAEEALRRPSSP